MQASDDLQVRELIKEALDLLENARKEVSQAYVLVKKMEKQMDGAAKPRPKAQLYDINAYRPPPPCEGE